MTTTATDFNPHSPTCGIAEAIAKLPSEGGRVVIPAGTYRLRQPVMVPSNVRIVGEGPATVLTLPQLRAATLAHDAPQGEGEVVFNEPPPFSVGDGIGLTDSKTAGWHGTHAVIVRVEGRRVILDRPLTRPLSVELHAEAVTLFPAFWSETQTDLEIADLTIRAPEGDSRRWDFTFSAIHIVRCERVRLSNCTVIGWNSDGFSVQRGYDVQVTGCQAHNCVGHGFHPGTGLGRSIWSHNIGRGNGGDGLYFCMGVHHSVCSDNVFSHNGENGIGGVANGGDHHDIISNNVCSYNGRCGIDANRGEEQMMIGNLLLSNSQSEPGRYPGIRLHDLRNSSVQNNRCGDDQGTPTQTLSIVESGDSDFNLISGNLTVGNESPKVVGANSRSQGNLP
ncbi:MAG: right-handed parallel beta-helix repeat-containing protein [Candidatus Poribacteria bacterium]|nr:right-handed parallel beta-helix repeat-containing protein [Candidatus Poribacteria bacterium]